VVHANTHHLLDVGPLIANYDMNLFMEDTPLGHHQLDHVRCALGSQQREPGNGRTHNVALTRFHFLSMPCAVRLKSRKVLGLIVISLMAPPHSWKRMTNLTKLSVGPLQMSVVKDKFKQTWPRPPPSTCSSSTPPRSSAAARPSQSE